MELLTLFSLIITAGAIYLYTGTKKELLHIIDIKEKQINDLIMQLEEKDNAESTCHHGTEV